MPTSAFGLVPKERLVEYEWFQVRPFDWRDLAQAFAKTVGLRVQNAFASETERRLRVWYYTERDAHEVDLIECAIDKMSDPQPLLDAFNAHLGEKGDAKSFLEVHGVLGDRRHRWFALVTPEEADALRAAGAAR
jgi:hypothetical protein